MDYQVLRFFESIRNPILSGIFYFATIFLGGIISVFIGFYLYWCRSKEYGIQICINLALSGIIVQVIKVFVRIERPWIIYPSLHPVKNSLINASGYSFPSAHSQQATALFFTLAFLFTGKDAPKKFAKHKVLIRTLCAVCIVIVCLSRVYFGVHTPTDILFGALISLVACSIINILYKKYLVDKHIVSMGIIAFFSLLGFVLTYMVYLKNSPPYLYVNDTTKLCGAFFGFAIGLVIEKKYINSSTEGTYIQHILKILIGIAFFFIIEKGLKLSLGENFFLDFTRYLLAILFLVSYHPYLFDKICKKPKTST